MVKQKKQLNLKKFFENNFIKNYLKGKNKYHIKYINYIYNNSSYDGKLK